MIRQVLAYALYGLGHAVWWCFDRQWCGGMRWGTYRAYSALMLASSRVQGPTGNGPWGEVRA